MTLFRKSGIIGEVDIAPLAKQGTVTIGLVTDCQRYFDFHHSGRDVLEAVHPRELELGAIAMAILAYVITQRRRVMRPGGGE